MNQTNPNSSRYNAYLIELIEAIRSARVSSLEEIHALAADVPSAWRSHLIADALDSIAATARSQHSP